MKKKISNLTDNLQWKEICHRIGLASITSNSTFICYHWILSRNWDKASIMNSDESVEIWTEQVESIQMNILEIGTKQVE